MQYGFLNKSYKSVEERDEWENDVRAFLTTRLDVTTIGRVDGPLESGEMNLGLYFPLTPRIHRFFTKNGFKVDHTVGDYVFYAGELHVEEENKLDFRAMYKDFEHRYNPYPVDMPYYDAFGCALRDGLIDEETYKKAKDYYGSLWDYRGD